MSTFRGLLVALPWVALNAQAATEHKVNAAEISTGVPRNINWDNEAAQSPVWCGTACSYLQVSTAKIAPDSLWTYNPVPWNVYTTSIPDPASVSRSALTPAGTTDSSGREIVYDSPYYERGNVTRMRTGDTILNSSVFQSGNQGTGEAGKAAAALSYHVRVQNQSSGSRDYFIRFTAPKPTGSVGVPFYIGGPSQQQPMNVNQKKYAKSRSAADVLVNGLPVWSSAASFVIPEETSASTDYDGYHLQFGSAAEDDLYTVFVGRYASAATFEIDFIVRAESLSKAPTCGTVNESSLYPNPRSFRHCLLIAKGRELSPSSGQDAPFEIYSKDVSTPSYQIEPGIGGVGQLPMTSIP